MTKAADVPARDQFHRTKEELRKLTLAVEEIQRCVDVTDRIDTFEARAALERARVDIKTAGFWMNEALKILQAAPKVTP